MTIPFRPLGLLRRVIDTTGLEITYVYEDLLFIEHNAFLLQMGERGADVRLYFNTESAVDRRQEIAFLLAEGGRNLGLHIERRGTFRMSQDEESEQFRLEFLDGAL